MNDRSNIDAAWDDLLGEDEDDARPAPSVTAPAVTARPSVAPPPAFALPKVPTIGGKRSSSQSLPKLGATGIDAAPGESLLLPPPPEFMRAELSTEFRLDQLAVDAEEDGREAESRDDLRVGRDDASTPRADEAPSVLVVAASESEPASTEDLSGRGIGIDVDELAVAKQEQPAAIDDDDDDDDAQASMDDDSRNDLDLQQDGASLSDVSESPWRGGVGIAAPAVEVIRPRATSSSGAAPIVPIEPKRSAAYPTVADRAAPQTMRWVGIAAAAVVGIGVLWWMASGPSSSASGPEVAAAAPKTEAGDRDTAAPANADPPKTEPSKPLAPAVVAAADGAEPNAADDDDDDIEPDAADDADPADDDGADEVAADGADGADADPATPTDPTPTPTQTGAVTPPEPTRPTPSPQAGSAEYDAAAATYAATGSQDALLDMALTACAMEEAPRAREAFRKLKGRELRSRAMIDCRAHEIDVTLKVEGYTAAETLRRAQRAFDAGNHAEALELARASNRLEKNSDAMLLAGLAACAMGDADEAERLQTHVAKKSRPRLVEGCAERGVTIE